MELLKNHRKAIKYIKPLIDSGRFYLAGGTAVYYYLQHRKSKDLDFFTKKNLDFQEYFPFFRNQKVYFKSGNTIHAKIQNVKMSFLYYPYKLLKPLRKLNDIHMASLEDILCMKINAIIGRGSRKDFTDLYFVVKELSINASRILELYEEKFGKCNDLIIRKSLVFFKDADNEPHLEMLKPVRWDEIKNFFIKEFTNLK